MPTSATPTAVAAAWRATGRAEPRRTRRPPRPTRQPKGRGGGCMTCRPLCARRTRSSAAKASRRCRRLRGGTCCLGAKGPPRSSAAVRRPPGSNRAPHVAAADGQPGSINAHPTTHRRRGQTARSTCAPLPSTARSRCGASTARSTRRCWCAGRTFACSSSTTLRRSRGGCSTCLPTTRPWRRSKRRRRRRATASSWRASRGASTRPPPRTWRATRAGSRRRRSPGENTSGARLPHRNQTVAPASRSPPPPRL